MAIIVGAYDKQYVDFYSERAENFNGGNLVEHDNGKIVSVARITPEQMMEIKSIIKKVDVKAKAGGKK